MHYLPAHNERDNEELITHVARRPGGALGVVQVQLIKRETTVSELLRRRGLRAVWYSLEYSADSLIMNRVCRKRLRNDPKALLPAMK
jgi:hypothetical protein